MRGGSIEARRKKLIDLVLDDHLPASEVKDKLNASTRRREELEARLKDADEPPPLLTAIVTTGRLAAAGSATATTSCAP
jgi:hypothetical protein